MDYHVYQWRQAQYNDLCSYYCWQGLRSEFGGPRGRAEKLKQARAAVLKTIKEYEKWFRCWHERNGW